MNGPMSSTACTVTPSWRPQIGSHRRHSGSGSSPSPPLSGAPADWYSAGGTVSLAAATNHRGGKGRGDTARMSMHSHLERTPQLGSCGLHRVHLLLYPSKIFRHGNKNTLFLVMVHSALFNYVFKAFKLFWSKCVASIQLPGNGIGLLSIPQSSDMTWFWWFTSQNVKNKGSTCSWQ